MELRDSGIVIFEVKALHNEIGRFMYHNTPTLNGETFSCAKTLINDYIWFYNNERIQLKTGEAPLTRRFSA